MTNSEARELVMDQIGEDWDRTNLYGVRLRHCLVEPILISFIDVHEKPTSALLVLLEHPETRLEYGVVYDEAAGKFGIAQFAAGYERCLLGLFGDFFTTLEAM